jgi:hypothetical protein
MTENKKRKKNFIDPALAYGLGAFTAKAIIQSVVGWMGLEFFKAGLKKTKEWCCHGKSDHQGISKEEPSEKT